MAVSDASGNTAERALTMALAQFPDADVEIRRVGEVQTEDRVEAAVAEAAVAGAFIAHTLVVDDLRRHMYECGRRHSVPTVDLMGPLLMRLQDALARTPVGRPGAPASEAIARAEAMRFTVEHDDGQRIGELDEAEIVLVGPSRTTKTPTSVFLSYYGWRVANVPLVPQVRPPAPLVAADPRRVLALTIDPERLQMFRRSRARRMGAAVPAYTDLESIEAEIDHVRRLCRERGWRAVDITDRSIEETAAEILALAKHGGASGGPGAREGGR